MDKYFQTALISILRPRKIWQTILVLLTITLAASTWLLILPAPAVLGASMQIEANQKADPTPIPQVSQMENASSRSPVVGVLVLLAPLVFLAWRSRGVKQPKIIASCCVPVIDENKRPFQIVEDEQEPAGQDKS